MPLLRSGTLVLAGKLLQLATGACVALVLPGLMGEAQLGVYFLAQVAIAAGAVIAQYGLTFTVPAAVGEALARRDDDTAGAICRTALLLCLSIAAAVCLVGWLVTQWGPASLRASFGVGGPAVHIALAAIPLAALAAVLAEMHRVTRGMALASLLPNAQGAAGAGFAVIALALAWRVDAAAVLAAGAGGLALAVASALAVLQQRLDLRSTSRAPAAHLAGLAVLAWPALLTSVGATVLTLADQAIVGAVGGSVDAAHYGLGLRVSTLLSLPLAIVNMTIVPHIVADWTAGRKRRLQWLLTTSASAAAAAAALGLAGIAGLFAIGPETIWGPSYAPALTVAAILGIAQVFHTAGGSSGYLLMLLGHQKVFMRISLTTGTLAIAAAPWVMARWGIVGVASVMAAALVVQTVANARYARRLLGLDARPRPINPFRWRRLASE